MKPNLFWSVLLILFLIIIFACISNPVMETKIFSFNRLEPILGLDGSLDFVFNTASKQEKISFYKITGDYLPKITRICPVNPVLHFLNTGFPFFLILFSVIILFFNFYQASRMSSENDPDSILPAGVFPL